MGRRRYREETIEVDLESNELLSLVTSKWDWITLERPFPQYVVDRFGMVLGQTDWSFPEREVIIHGADFKDEDFHLQNDEPGDTAPFRDRWQLPGWW